MMRFIVQEKKTDIAILKVMIKNLYCCFCTKTKYSFYLVCRSVEEEVCVFVGGRMKGVSK